MFPAARARLRLFLSVTAAFAALGAAIHPAHALVEGATPSPLDSYRVFGDGIAIGNSLMENPPPNAYVNSELLAESTANLNGLPSDAGLQAVYLWWSGSLASGEGMADIDTDALLSLTDGSSMNVSADDCQLITTFPGASPMSFYYCRADVTAFVDLHPGPFSWNGAYTVGDVYADPGLVTGFGCAFTDPRCQAKYAAWSMVFVFDSPTETLQRDVILYDGFVHMDETGGAGGSSGIVNFNIGGFLVGTPAEVELTYFGLEGDQQLGAGPGGHCDTCPDFFAVNGSNLTDGFNPSGNSYNSSDALGLDIDEFRIGTSAGGLGVLDTGDTMASISTGTGDNIREGGGADTGESVFLGYVFLRVNRPSPNFRGAATQKIADPPSAATGETIFYSINLANQGSLAATGVSFSDTIPVGATYVAGSLRIDGVGCTDAADADSCRVTGGVVTINLGNIPSVGDNDRQITFRATMAATGIGEVVCNTAVVSSIETPTPNSIGPACTTVESATIGLPTKSAVDLTGGATGPGDIIQYTVSIPGDPSSPTSGVSFTDDVPAHVTLLAYTSPGGGAVDGSVFVGGAFGNGRVSYSAITIPSGGTATITITVRVDDEPAWVADGVPAANIHGQTVCNQGQVSAGFLPMPLLTDNTSTPAAPDASCLTITYAPLFGGSSKTVVDDDGGGLEPGDTLTYTIQLANSGNRQGTITLTDPMPAAVENFTLLTPLLGATFTPAPAGVNGTGELSVTGLAVAPGTTATIQFRVRVQALAADGTVVVNSAQMTVAERVAENRILTSAALTVFSRPDLSGLSKSVTDLDGGTVEPGDTLRYDLGVTNTGNRPATMMVLTDPVSVNLTTITVVGGVFDPGTRTITWSVASLAIGETFNASFTAVVVSPLANGTVIDNQATIDSVEASPAEVSDDPATVAGNDPTRVTVVSAPNLAAAQKSVVDLDGGTFEPGDIVEYTLTVSNAGSAIATDVDITDPVDANLTAVTPQDGGVFAGGVVTWSLGAVGPGASRIVRFQATVRTPLLAGTVVSNQASVTTPELVGATPTDDPATAAIDDATSFIIDSAAILTTSIIAVVDVNGGATQPGDLLRYTVTITNTGTSPATGLAAQVALAVGLGAVVPEDGGAFAGGVVTWSPAGTLNPGGAPVEVHFTATVAAGVGNGTTICETAVVDSAQSLPFTTAAACITVVSRPDFAASEKVVIDLDGGVVEPGDVLEYQIAVVNAGTEAGSPVVVTDVVDLNLGTVTPASGGVFDAATRTITWTIPTVAAGTSQVVTFRATVALPLDDGTVIANQADIMCANGCPAPEPTDDPLTAAPDDPTLVVVASAPDFIVAKTFVDDDGGVLDPGDAVTYTITLTNEGDSCADLVRITDALAAALGPAVPGAGGTFDAGTGTVTWDSAGTPALLRLCPGTTVTLPIAVPIDFPLADGTAICNRASVTSEEVVTPVVSDDPATPAPDDATCTVVVSGALFTGATKIVTDAGGAPFSPGDVVTYTIAFTNAGNADATGVVVRDPIDPALVVVTPGQGGTLVGGEVVWDSIGTPELATVTVGETITLTVTATIGSPLDDGTPILNQATITAAVGLTTPALTDDPATVALDDPTIILVTASAVVTATKTALDENAGVAAPNDIFLYTITLANAGDAIGRNAVVTDALAPALAFVEALDGGVYDAASRTITWSIAAVVPATPSVARFRARAAAPIATGTVISNQASFIIETVPVPGLSDDPSTPLPGDPTLVVIVAAPELSTSVKTVVGAGPGDIVTPGTLLTWEIRVVNSGDAAANAVVVTDNVDLTRLEAIVPLDGGVFDVATGVLTWSIAQVLPGIDAVVRFTSQVRADVPDAVVVANQAQVSSAETPTGVLTDDPGDPELDDPTDLFTDATPELTVEKTVTDDNGLAFSPGDPVTYSIRVTVAGPAHAYSVVVTDPVSPRLVDVVPGQGGVFAGGVIRWDTATTPALAHLVPGVATTLTFAARIADDATNGELLDNQAAVGAGGLVAPVPSDDPGTPTADDPTRLVVVAGPLLRVEKTVVDENGGVVVPGDLLEWTLVVENAGSETSPATLLFDPAPAQTEYVADSTTADGVPLADGPGGVSPLAVAPGVLVDGAGGAGSGDLLPGARVTFTFRTRVAATALGGTLIANQGFASNRLGASAPSDDPATPAPSDSTIVVVGGGPILAGAIKTYDPVPVGDDGDGLFQPGEIVHYRVSMTNSGASDAHGVTLVDALPAGGEWVAGSLRLDGASLTDPADGDAGEVVGGRLTVRVGDLAAGTTALVEFRVRVGVGALELVNQGEVTSDETAFELTDADGNDGNGDQETITPVGDRPALTLAKTVADANGGVVEAGDELLYTLQLGSQGSLPLADLRLEDLLPVGVSYVPGSTVWPGLPADPFVPSPTGGSLVLGGLTLAPGETLTITFRAIVQPNDAEPAEPICNDATATVAGIEVVSAPACVTIGGVPGVGRLVGRVFIDGDERDRVYVEADDQPLADVQLQILRAEAPGGSPLVGLVTDAEGRYRVDGLPPGRYVVRALSSRGAQLAEVGGLVVEGGVDLDRDVLVDPSGRVYDSTTGRTLADVQTFLFYDSEDETEPGVLVPADRMGPGQQGQRTTPEGIYKYDVLPGRRYRLELDTTTSTWVFPSQRIPATPGFAPPGDVVANAAPSVAPGAKQTWYLRFYPVDPGDDVRRNHVPLDPLATQVRLDKRADRPEATLGDIVVYTVAVKNRSPRDLDGVYLLDAPARGLSYLRGHAAVEIVSGTEVTRLQAGNGGFGDLLTAGGSGRLVRFGPFDLPAGGQLTLTYQVVVGLDTRKGVYENRAVLADAAGVELSNSDRVPLRVADDPDFDLALLVGRVFCDDDGDGRHDWPAEGGVPGARVYIDTGSYAVADQHGRWHLSQVEPGLRLLKLDIATLPPGSTLAGDAMRLMHMTRGLPDRASFPVRCGKSSSVTTTDTDVATISLSGKTVKGAATSTSPKLPKTSVTVTGDLAAMTVAIDGAPLALPAATLALAVDAALLLPPAADAAADAAVDARGAPNLAAPLSGGFAPAPILQGAWSATSDAARWVLEVSRVAASGDRVVVRTASGDGAPGAFAWDGKGDDGQVVASDAIYTAQLRVVATDGAEASSARVTFGVAFGVPKAPERVETLRGTFFGVKRRVPIVKPALRRQLIALARTVPKGAVLEVEVHGDGRGDVLRSVAATQAQADAARAVLTGLDSGAARIVARGRGGLEAIAGTRTRTDRAKNQRVVIRIVPPPPKVAGGTVPAPAKVTPDALVEGEPATVDEAGHFVRNVPIPADGTITLDLLGADTRRVMVVIRVGDGTSGVAAAPTRKVTVAGDVATGRLTVDGQPVDGALLGVSLAFAGATPGASSTTAEPRFDIVTPPSPRRARGRRRGPPPAPAKAHLDRSVAFDLVVPEGVSGGRWELVIRPELRDGARAAPVYRQDGDGRPPPLLSWDGLTPGGELAVRTSARYLVEFVVEDARGGRADAAPRSFTIGAAPGALAAIEAKGTLFDKKGAPTAALKKALVRLTAAARKRSPSDLFRIALAVALRGKDAAQPEFTVAARASTLKIALAKLGAPVARIDVVVAPAVPAPAVARRRPRAGKVVDSVRITAHSPTSAAAARVVVAGRTVGISGTEFTTTADLPVPGALVIELTSADGRRATFTLPVAAAAGDTVPDSPSVAPAGATIDSSRPGSSDDALAPGAAGAPGAPVAGAPGGRDDVLAPADNADAAAATTARLAPGPALTLELAHDASEFGGAELDAALSDPVAAGSKDAAKPAPESRVMVDATSGARINVPNAVRAADLVVSLPPRGLRLRSPELWLAARTHKTNRLRVNGREVPVDADGRYAALITLPLGASTLVVEATDVDDNVARISWPVAVSETEHFLLVLADGAIASAKTGDGWSADGAALDGWGEHDSVVAGSAVLHGRVAAYYKGRFSAGKTLGPVKVTGHLDTAKQSAFEEFSDTSIDPEEEQAVYGDDATEVRDARARGKLYLAAEAKGLRALIGNFQTRLASGGELFRYDRTVYGTEVDFTRSFAKVKHESRVFVSTGDARLGRDVNLFRATGGTLYYLRHSQLVEGGERVRVIVRDRDNGLLLSERSLARDSDYVIDYAGGRVMFREPISSSADGALVLGGLSSSQTPLDGHPVYVEVSYEHELDDATGGAAGGAYVRNTLFDTLAIGAGLVGEARDGDGALGDYSLAGVDLAWKAKARTTLTAEVARSSSSDAGNFLSQDGGLSFQGLDAVAFAAPDASATGKVAWKLRAETQLGDFWKRRWAEETRLSLYAQNLEHGFHAGGAILEQGRRKIGGQAVHRLSQADSLTLRYDSELAELPRIGPTPEVVAANPDPLRLDERASNTTTLQWAHDGRRLDWKLEAAYQRLSTTASLDDGMTPQIDTERFGFGGLATYGLSRRVSLRAGQEVQVQVGGARDPLLDPLTHSGAGRDYSNDLAGITTTLGADWELAEKLTLSGTGALRWNGDTAAQLGLKTPFGAKGSIYAQERFDDRGGRLFSTSVLGAEQGLGGGRGKAYGEYQLERGALGTRNRAVLGLGHKIRLKKGFSLALGYEHQQTFGGYLPDGTPTGENLRDVLHAAAEYLRGDRLRVTSAVEVRFDDGMHGQPGSVDPRYEGLVREDPRGIATGAFPDHGGTAPGAPLVLPPGEKLQVVSATAADWKWSDDLTFLGRFRVSHTEDLTNHGRMLPDGVVSSFIAARFVEASAGWAYRPLRLDWFDLFFRYAWQLDQRPVGLAGQSSVTDAHVASLAPIVELPMRLKLSGKVAWKRTASEVELMDAQSLDAVVHTWLWLLRAGYTLRGRWELGAEYRFLYLDRPGSAELRHGALAEATYRLNDRVWLGAGYNFSRFSDDELADLERDSHGFFLRVVGRY